MCINNVLFLLKIKYQSFAYGLRHMATRFNDVLKYFVYNNFCNNLKLFTLKSILYADINKCYRV